MTGGDDFLAQAKDGSMDLGAAGVDEYLLEIPIQEAAIGGTGTTPGTKTITVNRNMAKDGKVYVFVYVATNATTRRFGQDAIGIPFSSVKGGTVGRRECTTL